MRKRKLTLAISASITALCMLNTVQAHAHPQEDFMLLEQEKAANHRPQSGHQLPRSTA